MSAGDYWLGPDELETVFRRDIVGDLDQPFTPIPSLRPRLVVFAGQPGASAVVADMLKLDPDWGLDMLRVGDLDTFRPYHPRFAHLLDQQARGLGGVDMVLESAAWWWQQRTLTWARESDQRYNVYLPAQLDPVQLTQVAEDFNDAGYTVRLVAAAVPAAMSRLALLERSATARGYGGVGQLPDHDGPYQQVPQLCRTAAADPNVHRISVVTRDGVVHDRQRGPEGNWDLQNPSVDVLTEARAPSFSPLQRAAFAHRAADVVDRLDQIGHVPETVHDLHARILDELRPTNATLTQALQETLDQARQQIATANAALDAADTGRTGPTPGVEPPPPQRGPDAGPEPT